MIVAGQYVTGQPPCIVCGRPISRTAVRCCSLKCAGQIGGMRSHGGSVDWPEWRVFRLRELWAEGHPTAEIARRLGTTKNAVVGKAHRLDLPGRPSPIMPKGSGRNPRRATPPGLPQRTGPAALRGDTLSVFDASLFGIEAVRKPTPKREPLPPLPPPVSPYRTCQFITNDDPKHPQFCGEKTQTGSPYCPTHHAICYIRRPTREMLEDMAA